VNEAPASLSPLAARGLFSPEHNRACILRSRSSPFFRSSLLPVRFLHASSNPFFLASLCRQGSHFGSQGRIITSLLEPPGFVFPMSKLLAQCSPKSGTLSGFKQFNIDQKPRFFLFARIFPTPFAHGVATLFSHEDHRDLTFFSIGLRTWYVL